MGKKRKTDNDDENSFIAFLYYFAIPQLCIIFANAHKTNTITQMIIFTCCGRCKKKIMNVVVNFWCSIMCKAVPVISSP